VISYKEACGSTGFRTSDVVYIVVFVRLDVSHLEIMETSYNGLCFVLRLCQAWRHCCNFNLLIAKIIVHAG